MTRAIIMRNVRDPLGLCLNQKYLKISCVTTVSFMLDVWDPLGLHLNQKYLKSDQKWPSYGQVTNGRLCDSSENYAGYMGSIGASFEPKISKIGPEMSKLWPFYQLEVA